MKRLFSLLTAFALAAALCAPVMANDTPNSSSNSSDSSTGNTSIDYSNSSGVYVSAYTVTDSAGGEVSTIEVGDRINIVLKIVDYSSVKYCVRPDETSARINSAVFTAIALPPGTIHGTTPTPSGNTTGHSVADSHNSLVNTLSSSGSTKVSAMVLVVCA